VELRPYQEEARHAIESEWHEGRAKTLLVLPTGCHATGQRLLLADGSTKAVEYISYQDMLMGDDGKPRHILHITHGIGDLYKVVPVKGKAFIVTGDHKLTLRRTNETRSPKYPSERHGGEIVDVPVSEWLTWSKWEKHIHKLIRLNSINETTNNPYSVIGFSIEPCGRGDYVGFTVDGDNRYLLDDFTITHNCGKTICFSAVAADRVEHGDRVLIMAHRGELLEQAADKLKAATGLTSALEKAESSCLDNPFARVVVGSVQTLMRESRLERFPHDYFKTIIIDEAHHAVSQSYQNVLSYFDGARVLGVTATADRADMKDLGSVFDSLAYEYTLPRAIKDGYLSPIKAQTIPLKLDISKVAMSAGDFKASDVDDALEPYLESIADEMRNYCKGRRTVVFLPLVATSQKFRDILNARGFKAAEVNGESKDRAEILRDFAAGKYDVLCNSMLLTEGWDCPAVDCVVVLRPTKSRALYSQMVGRGTRLSPGKKELLLLDFLWMTERHELCRPAHLLAKDKDVAAAMTKRIEESAEPQDLEDIERQANEDVVREREESLAKQLAQMKKRKRKLVDPLQFEMSIQAEDLTNYVPAFGWELNPVSDKQKATLERSGIFPDEITCAGKAQQVIDRLAKRRAAGLTTPKQIRFLESRGFMHVGTWSFEAASNMIARISANGWRTPHGVTPSTYKPEV